jgi:methylmalonyl-CoA mutase
MDAGAVFRNADFPAFDRVRWRELAEKALAGAGFEDSLTSRTDDGLRIEPIYERTRGAQRAPRSAPDLRWAITQRVDDPDPARANLQARDDIAHGATGLAIVFEGAPNAFGYGVPARPETLAAVLDGIDLENAYLRIDAHPQGRPSVDWLVELLTARRFNPAKLRLSFGIDPAAVAAGTGRLRMSIEALLASMPQSLAHFFALGVPGVLLEADGRAFHNAGATEAQELGAMLASAVSHLRMFEDARQALVYAVPHIGFALSVDQDQFLSIAKIRAMRSLWARAQEACAIMPSPAIIHAETSYRMMTRRDPETNILRATVAGFAAATGGADSISILPYTFAHGLPDAFARRISRNTQLIMSGESRIDFVADPAAGSGGIEALTNSLCEAAWAEFQQLEEEGGILRSLASGKLQQRIAAARDARAEAYRTGERDIIGTTLYPLKAERPVVTLSAKSQTASVEGIVVCESLPPSRVDQSIGDKA